MGTQNEGQEETLSIKNLKEHGVLDIKNYRDRYKSWKAKAIRGGYPEVSKSNMKWILKYLDDLELGMNLTTKYKPGYLRVREVAVTLQRLAVIIQDRFKKNILNLNKLEAHVFFDDLENGKIRRLDGEKYEGLNNFLKNIKPFWGWYCRIKKNDGIIIESPFEGIGKFKRVNSFCYFTLDQLMQVLSRFNEDEKALLLFAFDSLVRFPKEGANILGKDVTVDNKWDVWVNVRISKTYTRKFNLTFSADAIKKYIKRKNISSDKPFFLDYASTEKYSERLHKKIQKAFISKFGTEETPGGLPFNRITLYSFRHSGAAHLRKQGVPIDKILYRAGWKSLERLNYYDKMLGCNGKLTPEDVQEPNTNLMQIITEQNRKIEKLTNLLIKIQMDGGLKAK